MPRWRRPVASWSRSDWWLLAITLIGCLPFVIAGIRLVVDQWIPWGDDAFISIKASDVWTTSPPLQGQRSTSFYYTDPRQFVTHPGPMQFYTLGFLAGFAGLKAGGLVFAGVVMNCLWVFVITRAANRIAGLVGAVVACAAVLMITAQWQASLLVRPYNLSSGALAFLAFGLCAAVVLAGSDKYLLPLVFTGAYASQTHLAAFPAITVATILTVAIHAATNWRSKARRTGWRKVLKRKWIRRSFWVFILVWLPVLIDAIVNRGQSNPAAMIHYAFSQSTNTVGMGTGVQYALEQLASLRTPPLIIGGGGRIFPGVLIVAVVLVAGWLPRAQGAQGNRQLMWAGRVATFMILAEMWSISRVEEGRSLLYGAVFLPVAYLVDLVAVLTVVVWARVGLAAVAHDRAVVPRSLATGICAVLVVGFGLWGSQKAVSDPNTGVDAPERRFALAVTEAAVKRGEVGQTVLIYTSGVQGISRLAPTLVYQLERRGFKARYQFVWKPGSEDFKRNVDLYSGEALRILVREDDGKGWLTGPPDVDRPVMKPIKHTVPGGFGFPTAKIEAYVY